MKRVCIILICLVLLLSLSGCNSNPRGMHFDSKEAMTTYLSGTWKGYFSNGKTVDSIVSQLLVFNDGYCEYNAVDYDFTTKESFFRFEPLTYSYESMIWDYKRGRFKFGETSRNWYIVSEEGKIIDRDYIYSKGQPVNYPSYNANATKKPPETVYSALSVDLYSLSTDGYYEVAEGKITNKGEKTYTYVKVRGEFLDESGNVIDVASTYAIGSEGLRPNESKSFRLSVPKDNQIRKARVHISDD